MVKVKMRDIIDKFFLEKVDLVIKASFGLD